MFGDRLRLARKRAGLSLRALADRLDGRVTAQALSKYEAGQMFPSSSVLMALAKELAVSIDFLMSNQVEELAGACVFLCSPASNFVNGHLLTVDGGLSAVI